MDSMIMALAPVFVVGLAIQQLLEILDPVMNKLVGEGDKKLFLGVISMVVGLTIAYGSHISVLTPMGIDAGALDVFVTGLIVSAGTETFNSILKFLGYAKDNMKVSTVTLKAEAHRDYVASNIMSKIDGRSTAR